MHHLETIIFDEIKNIHPLSGDDINQVYLLTLRKSYLVIKLNNAKRFSKIFETEAKGL